jgi:ubiquinol-cytochrome c reductase cytochrome b subunit
LKGLLDWLEDRTGLVSAVEHFIDEDIPASSGWHQVFGSVAVFLFLIQAFTGLLLAINYAPTPGEAYSSLHYILTEVTAGRLMHQLHHWGASMMIVVVVLHMVQVFLWGSYQKPREATWIAGVILLLLTLAYGLTGYLLPWDNKAYWGTVVVTQIAASIPGMGPYLSRLLGSTGDIGVVTFARFYSMHVLLLPPATILLIAVHVYLVRRHGVAPTPGDELRPTQKFYPRQVAIDTAAIFIAFAVLFLMAVMIRVPMERVANPNDTAYLPRPEWYFLFLFQLLKFFNGPLEIIGTVVLPSLAILALTLAPFIDRGKLKRVTQRTFAIALVVLAAFGWGALTDASIRANPPENPISKIDYSAPTGWMRATPADLSAYGFFHLGNCGNCHRLSSMRTKKDQDWLVQHFARQRAAAKLTSPKQRALAKFITHFDPATTEFFSVAPQFAIEGSTLYEASHCSACHQVNGAGGKVGPPLNGISQRRTVTWLRDTLNDPRKNAPSSPMPAYPFNQTDMQNMLNYLSILP